MKFTKFLILFLVFIHSCPHEAQNLLIHIFSQNKIQSIELEVMQGCYQIQSNEGFLSEVNQGESLNLQVNSSNQIHVAKNGSFLGIYDTLLLFQSSNFDHIRLLPKLANNIPIKSRQYEGDFEIAAFHGHIQVLNAVFVETYLEGVLASEAGIRCANEYYKVQAIISRTFARNNLNKHFDQGFNLCDAVHCQAYYGNYQGELTGINEGVKQTHGLVLVDSNDFSFPTFFSANCGGQSAETDQIWNKPLPNYVSHEDTFCVHTRQANWEVYIPKTKFLNHLSKNYFFDISKRKNRDMAFNFKQNERKTFFIHPSFGIPLRDLRSAFKLRSTFFSCEPVGDKVLLRGRGFGHGIGLCQEGAMEMVKQGFSFKEILSFYFRGAELADWNSPISHW
jgi:stage II sporulation protein D